MTGNALDFDSGVVATEIEARRRNALPNPGESAHYRITVLALPVAADEEEAGGTPVAR